MFLKFDNLGEKTINKIAEVALSTQLEQTEKLRVNVKTDPNLLAQGMLESLAIDCQGLILENSLRMETINITLNTIAVSPFKALMGNIQLTKPSEGKACILLTEVDITMSFAAEILRKNPKNTQVILDKKVVMVHLQQVNCRLLETGKMLIIANVKVENTGECREVSLQITPRICQAGNGVIIEDIEYFQEPELSSIVLNPILEEAKNIFNLKKFKIEGFSLKIQEVNITKGSLKLQAEAGMTHFPNS
ncbi:DUF2993 domain-containing protein [Crocosphaera sp. XPORK-15E]|uniref:LmeA family phospholipid-binding protein n=1 Tax=Crocosphaera sp. XPORK-15E TaxID=3110247 RepID=UPI002B206F3B|nr:DUF2993 domain-containing protein [Crocosphaera sp. XPORK-15E]MEA5536432.1 DUF2993 domain-containing protein [Crocosphaera sp. XPORK-15E]